MYGCGVYDKMNVNYIFKHLQEIGNITQWLLESTDYRPLKSETCEIRDELDSHQKLVVIVMIWSFLAFLSIFYCYFCEQKLFPSQKLFDTCLVDRLVNLA